MTYPHVNINQEMIEEACRLEPKARVNRTKASEIDTLAGILGEFVFAQWFYGDWRYHRVSQNKGQTDFPDIEIKTSAYPFNDHLHLLVREDYARKRHPPFYIQIILNVSDRKVSKIIPGTQAVLCGYASHEEVMTGDVKDYGNKSGGPGGYRCHGIPLNRLHPMNEFRETYQNYRPSLNTGE